MDNKKMLSPAVVQRIISQLVRAINDMNLKNVIHRDIKLRNIMIHCPKEPNDKLLGEGQYQEEVDQEESNVNFDHKDAANEIEFRVDFFQLQRMEVPIRAFRNSQHIKMRQGV